MKQDVNREMNTSENSLQSSQPIGVATVTTA
jgi:hypothetical protein